MKRILDYILTSSFLFLYLQVNYAQEDSIRFHGLQIGVDLGKIIVNQTIQGKEDYLVLFDYEFKEDKFAALEIGLSNLYDSNDSISYTSKGNYGLIGLNFNMLEKGKRTTEDILFFGFRYGFSYFKQSVDSYIVKNYWGDYEGSIDNEIVKAHWAELVAGARAELWFIKNVSLTLSFRPKYMITWTKKTAVSPQYIPGFGKTSKKLILDVNWIISYRIPFKKKFTRSTKISKVN